MVAKTVAPAVVAVQDLDCIDRAKFSYALPVTIPAIFLDQFLDARLTIHAFSRFAPRARDLFSITKPGFFRCDGIVGGDRIIVSFDGDPLDWPVPLMADFDRRLRASGFSTIDYVRGKPVDCATCPSRFEKQCRGAMPQSHMMANGPNVHPQA